MKDDYEDDRVAQALLEQAQEITRKLNRRLARLGKVYRYSVSSHTSGRALDRRAAKRAAVPPVLGDTISG